MPENIVPLRIRHYVYVRQPPTGFAGATGCGKPDRLPLNRRSEERRVGKECRSRGAP